MQLCMSIRPVSSLGKWKLKVDSWKLKVALGPKAMIHFNRIRIWFGWFRKVITPLPMTHNYGLMTSTPISDDDHEGWPYQTRSSLIQKWGQASCRPLPSAGLLEEELFLVPPPCQTSQEVLGCLCHLHTSWEGILKTGATASQEEAFIRWRKCK